MGEVTVQDVYTLQIRRQSNHSNPSPSCEACKNGFVHVNSIQVRQFTQTGKLPGVCKSCNNSFLRICRLQIRHLTQSESHPHVCPVCNKSFTHAGNIKKHMLLHEQKEPDSQGSAKMENGSASILGRAVPMKKPKPPFECKDCGRIFIKYVSFLKHCRKHGNLNNNADSTVQTINLDHTEKPIAQEKESFSEPINGQNAHVARKVLEENFACEQCDRTFSRQTYLIRHYQTDHESEFPCQLCDKVFRSKPLLSSHMRSHKQHTCKLCKKSFTVPEDLELHLQNHLQEQAEAPVPKKLNYICSVCQRGFTKLGFLGKHFRTHIGHNNMLESQTPETETKTQTKGGKKSKIYRCKFCSKYYKFRRTLNKHVAESHQNS